MNDAPTIALQPCSAGLGYRRTDGPVAEAQAERLLSLPVHHALTFADVDDAADAILAFSREGR